MMGGPVTIISNEAFLAGYMPVLNLETYNAYQGQQCDPVNISPQGRTRGSFGMYVIT